jgi:hypothetical protein
MLIGLFVVPAATVCVDLSCLQICSNKNPFLRGEGGTDRAKFVALEFWGNNQNCDEQSRPTAWELDDGVVYGDAGGGILYIAELSKCADCMT